MPSQPMPDDPAIPDDRLLEWLEAADGAPAEGHLSLSDIVGYAMAMLPDDAMEALHAHIAACGACAEQAAAACEQWSAWCAAEAEGDVVADRLDGLIAGVLGDDPALSRVSLEIVRRFGPAVFTEPMQDAVRAALSPGSGQAEAAAAVVAALGPEAARAGIVEALHRLLLSGDLLEQAAAADAAGHLAAAAPRSIVAALAGMLETNRPPLLRGAAAEALGRIGPSAGVVPDVRAGLIALLADMVAPLRAIACDAVAGAGLAAWPMAALPALAPRLVDADAGVREAARRAVAALVPMAATLASGQVARWPALLLQGLLNPAAATARMLLPHAFGAAAAQTIELPSSGTADELEVLSPHCHPGDRFGLRLTVPAELAQPASRTRPLHMIVLWSNAAGMHCIAPREGFSVPVEHEPNGTLRVPQAGAYFKVGASLGHQAAIVVLATGDADPFEGIHTQVTGVQLEARLTDLETALASADGIDWWQSLVFPLEVIEE